MCPCAEIAGQSAIMKETLRLIVAQVWRTLSVVLLRWSGEDRIWIMQLSMHAAVCTPCHLPNGFE
jgi:hypothetical protein